MKFEGGPPSDAAVAQALSGLKREGGAVLVVGAAHASHTDVCERFLGGDDADRVLVTTDGSVHCDTDPAAVIDRPVQTRSAARASVPEPSTDLDALVREIQVTLERYSGGGPASIRVCFDSLRPYVDSTPRPALVSFLESLRETARATGAIVHLHLPAMADVVPGSLGDTVDAVVELNRQGESTYQQWYLPGREEASEWVKV